MPDKKRSNIDLSIGVTARSVWPVECYSCLDREKIDRQTGLWFWHFQNKDSKESTLKYHILCLTSTASGKVTCALRPISYKSTSKIYLLCLNMWVHHSYRHWCDWDWGVSVCYGGGSFNLLIGPFEWLIYLLFQSHGQGKDNRRL